ncbi:MAG: hypothetical protein QNK04_16915 [Myxococcota bacterium]|nr:hypothetical protein [Myxococcota bacterium]
MSRVLLFVTAALALSGCAGPPAEGPAAPTAYAGALSARPDPVDFGDTVVGCVRSVTVELSNGGGKPVSVTAERRSSSDLDVSASIPLTLAPGGSKLIDAHFKPEAAGALVGAIELSTDEAEGAVYRLATTGNALPRPEQPTDMTAVPPLDLVFVLDVSTTMDEMASLRSAIARVFDFAETNDLDVRFGLVTFVNDVVVHDDGEFLDRETFFREFDGQLVPDRWVPDAQKSRQLMNFDFEENQLGALHRAATDFSFRPGARRYFLLMTDATFGEPPTTFSDGTSALHSYEDVEAALAENDVRLFSVHASPSGRGLSANHEGRPSLVTQTRGTWFELSRVSSGELTLDRLLADLVVGSPCG